MIKVIQDFLPQPLFNYMKNMIENPSAEMWSWQDSNLNQVHKNVGKDIEGGNEVKLGRTLYVYPPLSNKGVEVYDEMLMPLFGVIQKFTEEHMEDRCKPTKMVRMKMNLYPNHGENKKHGLHTDIHSNGRPDPNIITSVFNFTTCDGTTVIIDKEGKDVVVPSIENSIVIFNGTHLHYGTTQTDTKKRIVLNTNLHKADVDPFSEPDKEGRQNFEPLDDYF